MADLVRLDLIFSALLFNVFLPVDFKVLLVILLSPFAVDCAAFPTAFPVALAAFPVALAATVATFSVAYAATVSPFEVAPIAPDTIFTITNAIAGNAISYTYIP